MATAAEDDKKIIKKNHVFEIPHIAFHRQSAPCVELKKIEKVEFFLWHTPVEESEAAAKQK